MCTHTHTRRTHFTEIEFPICVRVCGKQISCVYYALRVLYARGRRVNWNIFRRNLFDAVTPRANGRVDAEPYGRRAMCARESICVHVFAGALDIKMYTICYQ